MSEESTSPTIQDGAQGMGIYAAMAAVMADMTAIAKTKKCQQGATFNYRGIDDVYNTLNPLLGKHGIFVLPYAEQRHSESRTTRNGASMEIVIVRMRYQFCHADGSSVECVTIGEAMDSGDKATNKAMAIAHKYAILQAFCIPTEDMDDPDAQATALESREMTRARQQRTDAVQTNPDPMTPDQSKALMAYLTQRHGQNRDGYLAELSNFFGREITTSRVLTRAMVSEFLDAIHNGGR